MDAGIGLLTLNCPGMALPAYLDDYNTRRMVAAKPNQCNGMATTTTATIETDGDLITPGTTKVRGSERRHGHGRSWRQDAQCANGYGNSGGYGGGDSGEPHCWRNYEHCDNWAEGETREQDLEEEEQGPSACWEPQGLEEPHGVHGSTTTPWASTGTPNKCNNGKRVGDADSTLENTVARD